MTIVLNASEVTEILNTFFKERGVSATSFVFPSSENELTEGQIQQILNLKALNQKISAIRLYRDFVPGTGLFDAKNAVEKIWESS